MASLAELNRLFTAWCERVYHARPHSETGQPPMERWLAGAPFPVPDPAQLREAFLWSGHRIVRKDATLSLFGVFYQVSDLSLAGRKAECVFDPFDMSVLEVLSAYELACRAGYGLTCRGGQAARLCSWPEGRASQSCGHLLSATGDPGSKRNRAWSGAVASAWAI